jgi:hypothetical protein
MHSAVKPTARVVILGLITLGCAANARAQSEGKFALGAEYAVRLTDRSSAQDSAKMQFGPGLLWRFGHSKQGWGFHWGLNWYTVEISRPVAGVATELGELHIRPIMAGYGYTQIIGPNAIIASVIGGYAFGSMDIAPTAVDAYHNRLGAQSVTGEASNAVVFRPQIALWHDINKKIGVNANFGYIFARPDVNVNSSIGVDKRQVRADQFIFKVGAVYSIF